MSDSMDSLQEEVRELNNKKLGHSHRWDEGPFCIVGRDNQHRAPYVVVNREDLKRLMTEEEVRPFL